MAAAPSADNPATNEGQRGREDQHGFAPPEHSCRQSVGLFAPNLRVAGHHDYEEHNGGLEKPCTIPAITSALVGFTRRNFIPMAANITRRMVPLNALPSESSN